MTKYNDHMDMDYNMQSDMAEGSAWPDDRDHDPDFPEASGSGSGPGKGNDGLTLVFDYTYNLTLSLLSRHSDANDCPTAAKSQSASRARQRAEKHSNINDRCWFNEIIELVRIIGHAFNSDLHHVISMNEWNESVGGFVFEFDSMRLVLMGE